MPLSVMASAAVPRPGAGSLKNSLSFWGGRSNAFDYLSMNNKTDSSVTYLTLLFFHIPAQ
jgi:hypothetical protein